MFHPFKINFPQKYFQIQNGIVPEKKIFKLPHSLILQKKDCNIILIKYLKCKLNYSNILISSLLPFFPLKTTVGMIFFVLVKGASQKIVLRFRGLIFRK